MNNFEQLCLDSNKRLDLKNFRLTCVLRDRKFLATMRYCELNFQMLSCKPRALMTSSLLHKQFVPSCQLLHRSLVTRGFRELLQTHASVRNTERCPELCVTVLQLV